MLKAPNGVVTLDFDPVATVWFFCSIARNLIEDSNVIAAFKRMHAERIVALNQFMDVSLFQAGLPNLAGLPGLQSLPGLQGLAGLPSLNLAQLSALNQANATQPNQALQNLLANNSLGLLWEILQQLAAGGGNSGLGGVPPPSTIGLLGAAPGQLLGPLPTAPVPMMTDDSESDKDGRRRDRKRSRSRDRGDHKEAKKQGCLIESGFAMSRDRKPEKVDRERRKLGLPAIQAGLTTNYVIEPAICSIPYGATYVREALRTTFCSESKVGSRARGRTGSSRLQASDSMDDGTVIQLSVTIDMEKSEALFDFAGSGMEVLSSCNCSKAVTMSTIIHCYPACQRSAVNELYSTLVKFNSDSKSVADKQCKIVWVGIDELKDDVSTSSFDREALNQVQHLTCPLHLELSFFASTLRGWKVLARKRQLKMQWTSEMLYL
ncbi:hypothetical protein OSTOST_01258 [Ostertagia ostertagi]